MNSAETSQASEQLTPRIVIVGGGFAGLEVAKALGKAGIGAILSGRPILSNSAVS